MRYLVRCGQESFEIELERPDPDGEPDRWSVCVDGAKHDVRFLSRGGDAATLLIDDTVRRYDFVRHDGKLTVHDGRRAHELRVLSEREQIAEALFGATGEADEAGGEVRAVMPGVVRRVLIEVGARVCADQPLLIIEAMKMENEVRASAGGVVERIEVTPDDTVETGQLLLTLAPTSEDDDA